MARAIAFDLNNYAANGETVTLTYDVLFYGSGTTRPDVSVAAVSIAATDTPAQIRDKLVAAIVAEAGRIGYSVTNTQVLIPSYQRGV